MKKILFLAGLACVVLLALQGCASSPQTRFYVLSPPPETAEFAGKEDESCPALGIGPIEIPQYLARPQIATVSAENEVSYAEFDQWAEPLAGNFCHVLAEDLSRLVCTRAVYRFPWVGTGRPDYRVRVEVISMTGSPGGTASMETYWTVLAYEEKRVIASERTRYSEPVPDQGYKALVRAYSRMLAALAGDIAKAIPGR